MKKTIDSRIFNARKRLGNPYAFLDGNGEYSAEFTVKSSEVREATAKEIAESRRKYENPYAHVDANGHLTGIIGSCPASHKIDFTPIWRIRKALSQKSARSRDAGISSIARILQKEMWKNREDIQWKHGVPDNPVELLKPDVAAGLVGFDVKLEESLGQFDSVGKTVEIAGIIDRRENRISISRQFAPAVRNFTMAHELGHALLHEGTQLHRDRGSDGSLIREPNDRTEIDADRFAVHFLMPEKLVRKRFQERFLTNKLEINDDTAFALIGENTAKLRSKYNSLRSLSRFIAEVEQYNLRFFTSLASEFHVSREAMAIRLEELGLVQY